MISIASNGIPKLCWLNIYTQRWIIVLCAYHPNHIANRLNTKCNIHIIFSCYFILYARCSMLDVQAVKWVCRQFWLKRANNGKKNQTTKIQRRSRDIFVDLNEHKAHGAVCSAVRIGDIFSCFCLCSSQKPNN